MMPRLKLVALLVLLACRSAEGRAEGVKTPSDLEFHRQAVRRLVFDQDQAIPLSSLDPKRIVRRRVEHPSVAHTEAKTDYSIEQGLLTVSAKAASESALWVGGFNPYATYDVSIEGASGRSVEAGLEFASPDSRDRVVVLAKLTDNRCESIRFGVMVEGEPRVETIDRIEKPIEGPFTLRVQLLGSGLNVMVEQNGVTRVIGGTREFSKLIDLRRKEYVREFEYRLLTRLGAGRGVTLGGARAYLSPGFGQADICAMTYEDGAPILDRGRLWLTISIRGQYGGQGVFSLDPSVFDIRLEGVIVFDRGDGVLRNEIASHLFFDREARQWRGLTVGFSHKGDPVKKVPKQLWAVSSEKDPRRGFSIMKAKPVVMPESSEDPHLIYDKRAGLWRALACAEGKDFPAALYESSQWDGPYRKIAGPVGVNSTGCLLQKIGDDYYALFGSSDHKFYAYSYPDLKPLGHLAIERPPWGEGDNSRCWPNVVPLPDGYPAPYIALSMDRANFTDAIGWTYGALYLYHGHPKHGERVRYEYETSPE